MYILSCFIRKLIVTNNFCLLRVVPTILIIFNFAVCYEFFLLCSLLWICRWNLQVSLELCCDLLSNCLLFANNDSSCATDAVFGNILSFIQCGCLFYVCSYTVVIVWKLCYFWLFFFMILWFFCGCIQGWLFLYVLH